MMLHGHHREPSLFQLECVLGREVLGVQIIGNQLRLHVEEAAVVLDTFPEGAQGFVVL
jgi:hypothetical protein